MEKYITTDQIRTILKNAPPEVDKVALLKKYNDNGYKIQGYNDAPEKPKESIAEKIANFTGGKKIAQGLGQAIANTDNPLVSKVADVLTGTKGGIEKQQEQVQQQAMDIQGQLIAKIKEKKALGEDTSKLDVALKQITESMSASAAGTEELLNQKGITGKQVLGDAIQLGTTVLGAGQLPGVAKSVTGATGIVKGAVQGAKTGAITGGIYGASSGVSGALKEDKTNDEILRSGISGAIGGAISGGALGGIVGGVSGGIKANKLAKENFAQELVAPKLTDAMKQEALKQGRVTEQTLLSGGKITPSKRDLQLADVVRDIVSNKKSPVQNIDAISNKVSEINTGVKAYVAQNKVPFNTKQLTTQLNKGKGELKLIFASDKNAEKTYSAVVKEFIKHVGKKDTAGLLDARQAFDKIPAIKKLLDSQGLGENIKKEIVLTARTKANEYIAKLLPVGNQYRSSILNESKMIEAIGNIAEKNTGIIGVNKLQALTQKYPVLKWAVSGLVGAGGIGIGSTIIGSSD